MWANQGRYIPPVAVTKIVDAYGTVVEEYHPPAGAQVFDPRVAYQITSVLSDNNARLITYGPQNLLSDFDRPMAAKTGTTDNYRDTWTMGYTPSLVVGVWFGNTKGEPMEHAVSSLSAGLIWNHAMKAALDQLKLPVEQFPKPDGLVERAYAVSGSPLEQARAGTVSKATSFVYVLNSCDLICARGSKTSAMTT